MFPVTAGFLAALREPEMKSAVLITTRDGIRLAATTGSVDMDARRSIGRTADLELTATDTLTAAQVYDLVMTPGVEITVHRGLIVDGVAELVPLGVFATDNAVKPRAASGSVPWAGSDRSKRIARARFTDAYPISAGTSLAAAGTALLQSRWSGTPVDFTNVLDVLAADVVYDAGAESDPWKEAVALFADHGYDLAFDGLGVARALPVVDPSTVDAVFDFGSGESNLVTGGETEGTFEFTYNGAIVTGEGTGVAAPVRGEAWDDDPASPTYSLGAFGRVPYFQQSSILTTTAMCELAARTILARVKGRRQTVRWPSIVNPALTPLDVVTTTVDAGRSRLVLDKMRIPLRASEEMTSIAREVTVT
ncbi:MAG: DUF5047 domain-containing protein [Actinomycetota bacterium]|nr:DUF5047 domain-containing protein [Actinomycetota bacterium]